MSTIVTGHSHVWRAQRGVTIIELITVLVIVGVLGTIAAMRFFDRAAFDADTYADQTRAMLRYGQKLAVAQNRPVFARIDTQRIALCFKFDCAAGSHVIAPSGANSGSARTIERCAASGTWFCEAVPDGVTQATSGSAAQFAFDALGKPHGVTAIGDLENFQAAKVTIAGDRVIEIEPETGYVR